jgi:fructose-1,6-bisphosphatase I
MNPAQKGGNMSEQITLETYLTGWDLSDPIIAATAGAVRAIADACADIAHRLACGPLTSDLSQTVGNTDAPKGLSMWANDRLIAALKTASVAAIASDELKQPVHLDRNAPIAVAFDPINCAACLDANVPVGTIFSILPVAAEKVGTDAIFLQPGTAQIAAGYIIYGPQCALAFSVGKGTQIFTLDPLTRQFWLTTPKLIILQTSNEYAINASNYRYWSDSVRAYIDDCIAGADGPRGSDVNMRWIGSLVAECHRIFTRGGVFLYPRDARKGYDNGWNRLVFEANPISFLVEQAGGKAFDGQIRILDLQPTSIQQRTPLLFGSADEIDSIARYKADPNAMFSRSPLFKKRGLLRV